MKTERIRGGNIHCGIISESEKKLEHKVMGPPLVKFSGCELSLCPTSQYTVALCTVRRQDLSYKRSLLPVPIPSITNCSVALSSVSYREVGLSRMAANCIPSQISHEITVRLMWPNLLDRRLRVSPCVAEIGDPASATKYHQKEERCMKTGDAKKTANPT